jgi:hypothetical protein
MYSDVVTLSSGGSILRAWNLPDGQMIWETNMQTSTASKSLLHVLVCIGNLSYVDSKIYLSLYHLFRLTDPLSLAVKQ